MAVQSFETHHAPGPLCYYVAYKHRVKRRSLLRSAYDLRITVHENAFAQKFKLSSYMEVQVHVVIVHVAILCLLDSKGNLMRGREVLGRGVTVFGKQGMRVQAGVK